MIKTANLTNEIIDLCGISRSTYYRILKDKNIQKKLILNKDYHYKAINKKYDEYFLKIFILKYFKKLKLQAFEIQKLYTQNFIEISRQKSISYKNNA